MIHIEHIVDEIEQKLGQTVKWEYKAMSKRGNLVDGELIIWVNSEPYIYYVQIKNEIRQHQFAQLVKDKERLGDLLLIAERIFPLQREQLRQMGIDYFDMNCNVYLKKDRLLIWIEQATKNVAPQPVTRNRAFTKTGLKVLFQLLQDKELINEPQRVIAEKSKVALGSIPKIIEGLKQTGFLLRLNGKKYIWENKQALLERWVREYDTSILPGLQRGRYRFEGSWKDLQLNTNYSVWGGEAGGEILTDYLRAEHLILFTNESRLQLIRHYRLIPDEKGEVEVREKFWHNNTTQNIAPPLLIYADLLLSNNYRCWDTAKKIYEAHIKENL